MLTELARALRGLGKHAEAQRCCTAAVSARPDYATGWLELGRAQAAQGNILPFSSSRRRQFGTIVIALLVVCSAREQAHMGLSNSPMVTFVVHTCACDWYQHWAKITVLMQQTTWPWTLLLTPLCCSRWLHRCMPELHEGIGDTGGASQCLGQSFYGTHSQGPIAIGRAGRQA